MNRHRPHRRVAYRNHVAAPSTGSTRFLPRGWRDFWLQFGVFWAFYSRYEGTARPLRRRPRRGVRERQAGHRRRAARSGSSGSSTCSTGPCRRARLLPEFIANWTYFNCQFLISFGFMLWVYFRRNYAWYFMRNVLIVAGFIGPHRLHRVPHRAAAACSRSSASSTRSRRGGEPPDRHLETFANPYAAMPSLHTAYALIIGTSGFLVCRRLVCEDHLGAATRRWSSSRSSRPATTSSSTRSPAPSWPRLALLRSLAIARGLHAESRPRPSAPRRTHGRPLSRRELTVHRPPAESRRARASYLPRVTELTLRLNRIQSGYTSDGARIARPPLRASCLADPPRHRQPGHCAPASS